MAFQRAPRRRGVDVVQADATRCGGITGFLVVDAQCYGRHVELSAHGAPQVHAHVDACAVSLRHAEYLADSARVERMLFDGVLEPVDGCFVPDLGRAGLGIQLKRSEAERYAA